MGDEGRDRWGYGSFSPNQRHEPHGRGYGAGGLEGEDRGDGDGEQWSRYDPGHDGPAARGHMGYGYDRLERRPAPEAPPARRDRGVWDRAVDELHSWFGDREAERRRQYDAEQRGERRGRPEWRDEDDIVWSNSHRGRGPQGYRRPDARIGEDIADRLTDDPHLDASHIHIHVAGGEVTLSGRVASASDRRRAENLADRVFGVTHVQNALKVTQR